ncbi:uncharacterized protein [Oryza sativa Japonica Group]|uniref:Os06g0684500 protein n=2 Tax=Oryza sativa subsp. japonica TaxID=39947 RepID=Q0DA14_ORYSJ|nr:uncharacterized protein LOC4341877 [Oryza sativa Japonica Group]KAB8103586.1 hypothetical protein EE612_036121 [Oryza sativa]BAF20309.1 Os06g0684500 [Oryza sativa Japonica Group]BAG94801.1 unnamed protein product [Oryza sativa Japonica Group]BAS99184.1 Os06g0684500 [Oryza sativa Japonica Group]|eukprot:NP_001058395.1 Os06g0684500 [Oryza sativa Japonica Group]
MKIGDGSTSDASVERVVPNSSVMELLLLTRANYHQWALVMRVSLEALELWDAVEAVTKDRRALATILHAVPPKMKVGLAVKTSAKEAWDSVKKMRAGDDRVKSASVQRFMKEFENMMFRDGETVGDFAMRINGPTASLRDLGEEIEDSHVVKKVLRVVPKRLKQVTVAIEMLEDMDDMSVEELVGRLQVAVDADVEDQTEVHGGQLLLAEEQWEASRRQRGSKQHTGSGVRHDNGKKGDDHGGDCEDDDDDGSSTSSGLDRQDPVECAPLDRIPSNALHSIAWLVKLS